MNTRLQTPYIQKFRAAMANAGLNWQGDIIADGKLHRFKAEDDHNRNSWFILYPRNSTAPAAGAFGCWKRGVTETWCEKCRESLTATEWQTIREGWKLAEAERERTEKVRHEKARKTAAWILEHSKPVTAHGYLTAKGVQPHGGLKQRGNLLVLPLRDSAVPVNAARRCHNIVSRFGRHRMADVKGCVSVYPPNTRWPADEKDITF
jgi:putative DNA primase/helicase